MPHDSTPDGAIRSRTTNEPFYTGWDRERSRAEVWLHERASQDRGKRFRRQYEILRNDTDKLVQLTSDLRAQINNGNDSRLTSSMAHNAAAVEKLAHEVRAAMAGKPVAGIKPSSRSGAISATGETTPGDARRLVQRVNDAAEMADNLRQAVRQFLAGENEHSVSVDALKSSNSEGEDPRRAQIMALSSDLEQLAFDLRAQARVAPDPPASSGTGGIGRNEIGHSGARTARQLDYGNARERL
jgi:hypothetical protein